MRILALDQSPLNCGWAYGDSTKDKPEAWGSEAFDSCGENGVLRISRFRKWSTKLIAKAEAKIVYVEQIVIGRDPNLPVTYQQFEVVAGIEAGCEPNGADCYTATIGQWRARFLGRGNAPKWSKVKNTQWLKERALQVCFDRGLVVMNHHIAEAIGIWDFACSRHDAAYAQRTEPRRLRTETEMLQADKVFNEK